MYQKPRVPSPELKQAIIQLAAQPDIRSISCPFTDFDLWQALLAEQVRRANASGLALQEALCLMGPDCGIPGITAEPIPWTTSQYHDARPDPVTGQYAPHQWCGEIHIPYEGTCSGDLFILPPWHKVFPETQAEPDAKFHWLVRRKCNYLLTDRNLGEFNSATRSELGGGWLYQNKAPYMDCNPFHETLIAHKPHQH